MNSEVYRKDFTFHDAGIRRGDFQYGNRNNCRPPRVCEDKIYRHRFRKIPKPNEALFQSFRWPSPESQSAVPYYSKKQPLIPDYYFKPYFPIPPFWGLHFPNVFRFQNSSTNSVQFPSAPSGKLCKEQRSRFAENKGTKNNALKSSESGINEDVEYLYTVQLKGDELVEVVDLTEDPNVPSNSNESRISDPHLSSMARESVNGNRIKKKPEKETPAIPKKKDDRKKGRKRKNSSEDILCDICESEHKFIKNRGEDMYKSRCGHMFCQSCLKGLNPYKCPECNIFFKKLFKVLY